MKYKEDSLTYVVLGDWNYSYLLPAWISQNVFETSENITIELSVSQGNNQSFKFKHGAVSVIPSQKSFTISCDRIDDESITLFEKACINFMKNGLSPLIVAYGVNVHFVEDDLESYSRVVDSLPNNDQIVEVGAEIIQTQITRVLKYGNKIYNISFSQDPTGNLVISVNQHNDCGKSNVDVSVEEGFVRIFIESTEKILLACGFTVEQEED